jgi:hypothetical protein
LDRAVLGLALEVDPAIEIPGMEAANAPSPSGKTPTRVLLDPDELRRRWSLAADSAERVRELRDGSTVLLNVELAPSAGYLVRAPGFARILVSPDGTELLCEPEAEGSEWCTLLSAQALPLAATLRGLEVLHASGVVLGDDVLDGGAVLLAGPQGAGKSSLAAALLRGGATLLSDDTVALEERDGALLAHPAGPLLQLRADEYERLSSQERAMLGPTATVLGKQRFRPGAIASAAPFGALFLLQRSAHGVPMERIDAVDPFELLASTFNLSVRTPERLIRHLDLAASLAATGRIYRLRVQPGVDATQLADVLRAGIEDL